MQIHINKDHQAWNIDPDYARTLINRFGSPLYVYSEEILRRQCRKLMDALGKDGFEIRYAMKANSSIALLKIIKEEGLDFEVMTPGEIYTASEASINPDRMLFVSNNVSVEAFKFVSRYGLTVCLDSIDQIDSYGGIDHTSDIYIRLNPGAGDGHSAKVVTAGKVKFGIDLTQIDDAFAMAKKHRIKIIGFCMHIGSLFLDDNIFQQGAQKLLDLAEKYPDIRYVDFGGGMGIPYDRRTEKEFPLESCSEKLEQKINLFKKKTGRELRVGIQPGRFIVAECGLCLTRVISVKTNMGMKFVGTDLGFNFLLRPALYSSYHEIINLTRDEEKKEKMTVVGNVCESGDILGENLMLPAGTKVGDILLVRDTGAYGYSMASNYNSMPRPAEILLDKTERAHMIRKPESYEDIIHRQIR